MDGLIAEAEVVEVLAPEPEAPAAPVTTQTQAIDLDDLVGEAPAQPAPAAELDADAFIDTYTPAAPEVPPAPQEVDPRVAWRKKNADALKAKDAEEAAAKKEFTSKAAEHLKKAQEARAKTLSTRKDTNRQTQKLSPDAGVPQEGSSWEKVTALVNFNAGTHQKDVGRFKSTLISLKAAKA